MKFDLNTIKENPSNPRKISDEKFAKLKTQIKDMPETLKFRPIVINKDNVIVAGNMRHRALLELGMDEVPSEWVAKADDLTDEQVRKFIIIDNIGYGEHDWEMLQAEWDFDELEEWGLDIPLHEQEIDKAEEGEDIEIPQSVQIEPPQEYILIMAEPNSVEWEDLKETLKLKMVRRGGYKKGSGFDSVALERVLRWEDFKNRLDVNSSAK